MRTFFAAALFVIPVAASAEVLLTPRFNITVIGCDGEVISCGDVRYVGVNRKTGASVNLRGRTMHSYERDGITPNQFLGYEFKNGKTIYRLHLDGVLEVTQSGKTVVSEQGTWIYE